MSSMGTFGITEITIDNRPPMAGQLEIEHEVIAYRSATATKPDASWTLIDDNGHFHAYDDKGELPTLTARTRHVDCDGSCGDDPDGCEGYDATEYFCAVCDLPIKPERLSDTGEKSMQGRMSWHVIVHPEREIKGEVTVRATAGDRTYFGVAHARTESMEGGSNGVRITTRLYGISPLGQR